MLIIICCPKPFDIDEYNHIQYNAILSWSKLNIDKKIIVVGDEKGNKEFCDKNNIIHCPEVEKNNFNTPLVKSIFLKGVEYSENDDDIIMYINSDIVLLSNFTNTIEKLLQFIQHNHKYLIVGQRTDIDQIPLIDFNDTDWEGDILKLSKKHGKLHPVSGIDYFIFSKNTYNINEIPNFAIGKFHWDRWLLGKCIITNIPTLDITESCTAIHQNGDWYINKQKTNNINNMIPEIKHNVNIDVHIARNINHCIYKIQHGSIIKNL